MTGTGSASRDDALIVAIDVGGSSTKASVFDLRGRVHADGRAGYRPRQTVPGSAEYDAHEILDAVTAAIAQAVAGIDARRVAAVSVDAMMSGAVPIDEDGRPVAAYTTTLDTRFGPYLERTLATCGQRVRRLTGSSQPTLGPKIAWLTGTDPEAAARAATFTVASGLVVGFLAGLTAAEAVADVTHIWTTGLADVTTGRWDDELCERQGVDPARLPRLTAPTEVIGGITAAVAAATGLRVGTPVTAGCGDQPAGYVGAGAGSLGRGADSAGTYAVLAGVTARSHAVDTAPTVADAGPDLVAHGTGKNYNCQVMVIGGGLTRQWVGQLVGPSTDGSTRELSAAELATLESAAADSGPGARGVRCIPHLGGLAYPARPALRGAVLGLSWAHGPGDLYRATLEGIALSNRHLTDVARRLFDDLRFDEIVVYGGGAHSDLWNQIKADVMGVRYVSVGDAPVTGLGAAMIGAQAVGLIDDAARAALRYLPPGRAFTPDPVRHDAYMTALDQHVADLEAISAEHP